MLSDKGQVIIIGTNRLNDLPAVKAKIDELLSECWKCNLNINLIEFSEE